MQLMRPKLVEHLNQTMAEERCLSLPPSHNICCVLGSNPTGPWLRVVKLLWAVCPITGKCCLKKFDDPYLKTGLLHIKPNMD